MKPTVRTTVAIAAVLAAAGIAIHLAGWHRAGAIAIIASYFVLLVACSVMGADLDGPQ